MNVGHMLFIISCWVLAREGHYKMHHVFVGVRAWVHVC